MKIKDLDRRQFLRITGTTTLGLPLLGIPALKKKSVSIIWDTADTIAISAPVQWAMKELISSLEAKGIIVEKFTSLNQAPKGVLTLIAGGADFPVIRQLTAGANAAIPDKAEALGLIPIKSSGRNGLLAAGKDERGLVFALLELADRVNYSVEPLASLSLVKPVIEQPANEIRSLNRLFVSDVEDKPWFYDKEMWPKYLTMLATQRFNRFNLSLGIGHDLLQNVVDAYFVFPYPFFMAVPGYDVRVPELPDTERDYNLETLRFISEQTVARGMQFQLGLWMHGYEWLNSPHPNYTIKGVTKENHGAYCRDAIRALLKACPAIGGITLRVHGESGVNEGSYDFWKMIFEGIATCGRKVEIDLHPKGTDQTMIDLAVNTGMPVVISPKYWAEHLGLPYHQADIRELEIPKPPREGEKRPELLKLSLGSRMFTRYGIGDLLKENRPYKVIHRIWPGTQRILLWGDPQTAAAYSRAFSFCGSAGMDLMEPLSFKGRRGSGIAGDRCGYKDKSLKPRWDWEKYLYTLRVWGRMQYNPDTEPEVWSRLLKKQFGPAASYTELALANATRILPVVLTAHGNSAANNAYWPEMYTNFSIVNPNAKHPYFDTPEPEVFGNVSPFDPQLFLSINDFVKELLDGNRSGKYTPLEAVRWMMEYADESEKNLRKARESADRNTPEFRRMDTDVMMQIGLGRFFGAKISSGVLYAIFEQTGDRKALQEALKAYKTALNYWVNVANTAKDIYKSDVSVGERAFLRGHWLDRIPAIEEDISLMAKKLEQTSENSESNEKINNIIVSLGKPSRIKIAARHHPPVSFKPDQPLVLNLSFDKLPRSARLYYRHVNHGERYQVLNMKAEGLTFKAEIPGVYTNTEYPLEYYFELRESPESACLFPGFNEKLNNQPYFVVRKSI